MTKVKKIVLCSVIAVVVIAFAVTAIVLLAGKKPDTPPGSESESQTEITLTISETEIELGEDEAFTLKATTNSGDGVKWSTSDPAVASVSAQGRVLAKSAGNATISAKVGEISKECLVKVTKNTGGAVIELEKSVIELSVSGDPVKINGRVTADGVTSDLNANNATFFSEDEKIAEASADGVVTPKAAGSTLVFVTSGGKTKAISIEVYTMLIATAEEWNAMLKAKGDLNARYLVTKDIDFTGVEYVVKTSDPSHVVLAESTAGYIDGGSHTVKNIVMPSNVSQQSLFGTVVGFEMENISFENVRFTAVACGIATRMIQHYDNVDENGNVIPNSSVIVYNSIKNVSLDFVYDYNGIDGICGAYYGGGLENVFLNMRMEEGKSLNKAVDYAFTDDLYVWYSNNYINNLIVLAESGEVSLEWRLNDAQDVAKDSIFVYGNKMEACYKASNVFDSLLWSVVPGKLPKLK